MADVFFTIPWLLLAGLVGMILRRRQHARHVAQADALADKQAAQLQLLRLSLSRRHAKQRRRKFSLTQTTIRARQSTDTS